MQFIYKLSIDNQLWIDYSGDSLEANKTS